MIEQLRNKLPAWVETSRAHARDGQVAAYIPELAKAPKDALGILITGQSGEMVSAGDCGLMFTMQSISKVFTLHAGVNR